MLFALSIVLLVFSCAWTIAVLAAVERRSWGFHPFFWYALTFILNGPVRGLLVHTEFQQSPYRHNQDALIEPLLFGFAFFVATGLGVAVSALVLGRYFHKQVLVDRSDSSAPRNLRKVAISMTILTLPAFVYGAATGAFNMVDGDIVKYQEFSVIKMLAMNCSAFPVFIFGAGLLIASHASRPRGGWIFMALGLGLLACRGIIGGGRGFTVLAIYLAMLAAFYCLTLRRALPLISVISIPLIFMTAAITAARISSTENAYSTRGASVFEICESLWRGRAGISGLHEQVEHSIWRYTYHLDAWGDIQNRRQHDRGRYPYGSITDLQQLVPTLLWKGKDREDFNFWMGSYLMDYPYLGLLYPVGRTGEAFYVGNPLGLTLALPHALLMILLFRLWQSQDWLTRLMYFGFLVGWSIQGQATIFWNLVNPIKWSLYLICIVVFFRITEQLTDTRNPRTATNVHTGPLTATIQ